MSGKGWREGGVEWVWCLIRSRRKAGDLDIRTYTPDDSGVLVMIVDLVHGIEDGYDCVVGLMEVTYSNMDAFGFGDVMGPTDTMIHHLVSWDSDNVNPHGMRVNKCVPDDLIERLDMMKWILSGVMEDRVSKIPFFRNLKEQGMLKEVLG